MSSDSEHTPPVVAFTGRKHHGKDSAAQVLVGCGYTQLRFADPLKAMLRAFYQTVGLDSAAIERRIDGDLKESPCPYLRGKTPRYAMQTLGTEWGRNMIADDLWTAAFEARARRYDKVVVSDARFPNEVALIAHMNGAVFRVDASRRVKNGAFSTHSSEAAVDLLPVDGVIDNNGTPEALIEAVRDTVEAFGLTGRSQSVLIRK